MITLASIATGALVKGRKNMRAKSLLLRAAMLGAILLGIASVTQPVHAFGCVRGAWCQTDTSDGVCGVGGVDNCECYGADGSEQYDSIDCAFL